MFGDFLLAFIKLDQLVRVGVVGFVSEFRIYLGIFAFEKMNLFLDFFKVTLTLAFARLFFFFLLPVIAAGRTFGSGGGVDRGSGLSVAISSG